MLIKMLIYNMYINIIIICILTSIFEASYIILMKQYLLSNNIVWIIGCIFCYFLLLISSYLYLIQKIDLSVVYALVKIFAVIIIVIYSLFILNEKFTYYKIIGIFFAIASILFLNL